MDREIISKLLSARGIKVSEEHLTMLEAQLAVMKDMRSDLDRCAASEGDIGLVHALKEQNND